MKKLPPPPEQRTVTVTFKVKRSVAAALSKAARDNGRTRSTFLNDIAALWLREADYQIGD